MNNNSNEPGAGMNAMTPFQFESHAVRTVVDDHGEVWFVGTDVATVLGYANPHKALDAHCKGVRNAHPSDTRRDSRNPDHLRA